MPHRIFLTLLAVLPCVPCTAAERPNFVFLLADDMGWGDPPWHGSKLKMPHLDSLCRSGIEIDQHYVSPMCSPTRAALLSGRYASRFGVTAAQNDRAYPFDTVTLACALKASGYETALIGKWHLGSDPDWGPQKFGFDYSYGSLAGGCGPWNHKYKQGPYTDTWHRNGQRITEEGHITDLLAREAVQWIRHRGDRPFFLYLPFTAVHIPIKEPQRWLDLYPDVEPRSKRQYAASASHMDDAVGQIIAALDASGKRANTLVIFVSDNGAAPNARNDDPKYPADDYDPGPAGGCNEPLRGQKTQLYEGGIHVPALANWPGHLKPGKFVTPMHMADWMPTLCTLAGFKLQQDLKWDGRDVWPWLSGAQSPQPRPLYWAGTGFKNAAVRDGDWKLIASRDGKKLELFNLAQDPNETTDLADRQSDRVAQLKTLLAKLASPDNDAKVKEP